MHAAENTKMGEKHAITSSGFHGNWLANVLPTMPDEAIADWSTAVCASGISYDSSKMNPLLAVMMSNTLFPTAQQTRIRSLRALDKVRMAEAK